MAGQFDKFVKILGTGSRPDVYKGAPGNPDIVAPVEVSGTVSDPNGGGQQTSPKKISQRASRYAKMRLGTPRPKGGDIGVEPAIAKPIQSQQFQQKPRTVTEHADEAAEHEINKKAVREYEQKGKGRNPRGTEVSANTATVFEKPSTVVGHETVTESPKAYVKEDLDKLSDEAYEHRVKQSEHGDILSTTMREVEAEGPANVVAHVPVRAPGEVKKPVKPTVNKPGNVIPQVAIDTFGSMSTDRKQAEAENKRIRASRGVPTKTTVFDPNKISAKPVRGQTPERAAVLGAVREGRAADLAAEGKTMTTVSPEVMDTAKRLGRTSHYNLDEDYMSGTGFLAHEAVQKATVAHALGVHHTLGTTDDKLHQYLGGRPLEAKARLAHAFKIVDRANRGNPPKVAGEFELLRGMVQAGSSPTQTLRAVRGGGKTDVVVNGMTPTLAESSTESRARGHKKARKITQALGSSAASVTAPLAGTNRVAVRKVGQAPEEAEVREFSPAEVRNTGKVPKADDSRGPRVIETSGLRPGEKNTNKTLKEEKDN